MGLTAFSLLFVVAEFLNRRSGKGKGERRGLQVMSTWSNPGGSAENRGARGIAGLTEVQFKHVNNVQATGDAVGREGRQAASAGILEVQEGMGGRHLSAEERGFVVEEDGYNDEPACAW